MSFFEDTKSRIIFFKGPLNLIEHNVIFHYFLFFRLFYAGAVEGQMPEILSMTQVNKMTPAPAVLVVVRFSLDFYTCYIDFYTTVSA